jgi:hypothetical protein
MSEEDPDVGRFEPKGDHYGEPREPFLPDEMLEKEDSAPLLQSIHVPKAPLSKGALKAFLVEIKPVVEKIQAMKREDQHKVGQYLQQVKESLHRGDLAKECGADFDKLVDHYASLLTHSEPEDQEKALEKIRELQAKL